ncbi:hypothetical protein KEM55_002523 [Ascosphaera atra]|nr:hypothetical protein KEM55_002523 [Ascosphaera atra]
MNRAINSHPRTPKSGRVGLYRLTVNYKKVAGLWRSFTLRRIKERILSALRKGRSRHWGHQGSMMSPQQDFGITSRLEYPSKVDFSPWSGI